MEVFTFIYNVFLLILYSIALTLSFTNFLQSKKNNYLVLSIVFIFYIFNSLIIYMTEFIETFSDLYNNIFLSVPTFKIIIIVVLLTCYVTINNSILKIETSKIWYYIIGVVLFVLLFIAMLPNSAMKVWLFYLPNQIFTFALSCFGLKTLKNNPVKYEGIKYTNYRKVLIWTLLFSVLILIEDTFVIFYVDEYSDIILKINNRSISEDVMYVGYSIFVIRYFMSILNTNSSLQENNFDESIQNNDCDEKTEVQTEVQIEIQQDEYVHNEFSDFYLFSTEYGLTKREQDVFKLLLLDMDNKEISENLVISIGTVKSHVHNIFLKADVSNRKQLIAVYNDYVNSL